MVEEVKIGSVVDGVDALVFEVIQSPDLFQVFAIQWDDTDDGHQKTNHWLDDYIAGQTFKLLFGQTDITSVLSRRICRMQERYQSQSCGVFEGQRRHCSLFTKTNSLKRWSQMTLNARDGSAVHCATQSEAMGLPLWEPCLGLTDMCPTVMSLTSVMHSFYSSYRYAKRYTDKQVYK